MSETTNNKTWSYLMAAGAVLLLVATFMTAMTFEISLAGISTSEDVNFGSDLEGSDAENAHILLYLGFLLAAVGAALGLVPSLEANKKFGGIASIVGGLLGLLAWFQVNSSVSEIEDDFKAVDALLGSETTISMGIGAWVALLGGVLALVGGGLSAKVEFT